MDASDAVTALLLASAVAVLCYASVLDWRTRRVPNAYWIGLSAIGLLLVPVQVIIDDEPLEYILVIAPILAILADVYWDAGDRTALARYSPLIKNAIAVAMIIALGLTWIDSAYFGHLLAIPVFMLVIEIFYMFDVIRGGADAKALIALSIMFPFYPRIDGFPLLEYSEKAIEVVLPFAFVVLINAALVTVLVPVGFFLRNLLAGNIRLPQMFLGYKMDLDKAKARHVWLMERMEKGRHVTFARPRRGEDLPKEIALLAEAGHRRSWVTPKIPFIIPILIGLLISTVAGNLIFALFRL